MVFARDGLMPAFRALEDALSVSSATAASTTSNWTDKQRQRFDREFQTPIHEEIRRVMRELESSNTDANRALQLLLQAR